MTKDVAATGDKIQVRILTSFGKDDKVFSAIRAGAQGYLFFEF